jgi:rhodanese-related sulfurtransferase
MLLIAIAALVLCGGLVLFFWWRRQRARRELRQSSIEPEMLYALIEGKQRILVFDIRQPLDLLAYSEIIPGSVRIPPNDLLENPALIPQNEDAVVYCTCPGEKTSLSVVNRAKEANFTRLKLLRGGLAGWKAKGYPVEPYKESFRLDTAR